MANTTARGYGWEHQRQREQWAPIVRAGGVMCARYGDPRFPDCMGIIEPHDRWDLGHDDHDRGVYQGPEHQSCNRRAGALKAKANRSGTEPRTDDGEPQGSRVTLTRSSRPW